MTEPDAREVLYARDRKTGDIRYLFTVRDKKAARYAYPGIAETILDDEQVDSMTLAQWNRRGKIFCDICTDVVPEPGEICEACVPIYARAQRKRYTLDSFVDALQRADERRARHAEPTESEPVITGTTVRNGGTG